MGLDTLGLVESRSIAAGVLLADLMVKSADVTLLKSSTLCSGRYLIQISGDRAAVETAVADANDAGYHIVGSYVISSIQPEILTAIGRSRDIPARDALAVIECRTASAGVDAADQALKKSMVQLARLVLGQGIAGKSYFIINGEIAEVKEAVAAASQTLGQNLVEAVVLPSPDVSVVASLMNKLK